MAHLIVETGDEKGKALPLQEEGEVVFGRDTVCNHQILDLSASRTHFRIVGSGGAFRLEDLDSRNGTFLNEDRIKDDTLSVGDQIRVGDTIFIFVDDRVGAPATGPKAEEEKAFRPKDALVGKTVGGYDIKELIGRGGMGTVYRATQVSLSRDVALKILSRRYTSDEKFIEMFVREARAAGALNHPNIVQVYDVGTDGDLNFFSMEFMARGTVGDMLKELGTISVPRSLAMVLHAAKGLEYGEKRGIIHCDIKPDNLMLTEDGTVKTVDLGLSRTSIGEKPEGEGDVAYGTPHFVSPEQAQRKKLDHRADIYSLGATFFLMITGYPVFLGDSAREIVMKHIKEPPPKAKDLNPAIPDSVSHIIDRMLKKNPDDRYPSASALLEDLKRANIEVNPQAAYTDGFPGIPAPEKSRPTGLIALGTVAVVVLLTVFLVLPGLFGGDDEPSSDGTHGTPGVLDPGNGGGNDGGSEPDEEERARREKERLELEQKKREFKEKSQLFREEQAGTYLKDAFEFEKKFGLEAFKEDVVVKRYQQLAKKYPDTEPGKTAKNRAAEMLEKRVKWERLQEEYEAERKKADKKVRSLIMEERFGKALAVYKDFPAKKFEEDIDVRKVIAGCIRFVQERAKDAWVLGATSAKGLEREGKFFEARRFYEKVASEWGMEPYVGNAKTEAKRLEKAATTRDIAAAQAEKEGEEKRLHDAEERAIQLAEKYEFTAAREEIRKLLPGRALGEPLKTEEARRNASALEKDYDHLVALMNRIVAQANARKGKARIRRGGREVVVLGADRESIEIGMGGAQTSIKWMSFTHKNFFDAASRILDPATTMDHLRLGVFAMVVGLVNKVETHLKLAQKGGNARTSREAARYQKRYHEGAGRAGKQLEARARALYGEIVDLWHKEKDEEDHVKALSMLREALEKLDKLKKEYAHTRFVKGRGK